jgi:hypothetical protein
MDPRNVIIQKVVVDGRLISLIALATNVLQGDTITARHGANVI